MTKSSCIVIALVTACASGGKPGVAPDTGGDDQQPDAPTRPDAADVDAPSHPDAAMPDAPQQPVTVTLQETVNNTIATANSIACGNGSETSDNTWYRAYALSDFGITNAFHVTQVSFAIQESAGTPSVQVKVGSYGGTVGGMTLDTSMIVPLNATTVTIPATTTGESVPAPITADIPAGGKLVVQIAAPNLEGTGKYVYIGASNGGENKPGYITSVGCAINVPTRPIDVDPVQFAAVDLIILVTGTHLM
jgi:hypothetical protein